ncbi:hypothetical protein [Afipia birgiae]|jgi:cbb3-type cytochrome oxidase subunit 1|uniref:hypothetical protein n=1 Tax=Afipia birgiae TaxID=151414 RepID=UPI00030A1014|nr:hypothetical protein [Afipia birgiae]
MKASSLSFFAAVIAVLIGMSWGIVMAISKDHSAMPAHAHLNLLGWVSLFLFGIFYRLHPSLEVSRTALMQIWVWIIGTISLTVGVAMLHAGNQAGEPFAGIGSFVLLGDMVLFGWLVVRYEQRRSGIPSSQPAE